MSSRITAGTFFFFFFFFFIRDLQGVRGAGRMWVRAWGDRLSVHLSVWKEMREEGIETCVWLEIKYVPLDECAGAVFSISLVPFWRSTRRCVQAACHISPSQEAAHEASAFFSLLWWIKILSSPFLRRVLRVLLCLLPSFSVFPFFLPPPCEPVNTDLYNTGAAVVSSLASSGVCDSLSILAVHWNTTWGWRWDLSTSGRA